MLLLRVQPPFSHQGFLMRSGWKSRSISPFSMLMIRMFRSLVNIRIPQWHRLKGVTQIGSRFLIGRGPDECRGCASRWQSGQTVHHRVGHTCSITRGMGSHFTDSGSRGGGGGSKRPLDRSWRESGRHRSHGTGPNWNGLDWRDLERLGFDQRKPDRCHMVEHDVPRRGQWITSSFPAPQQLS